MVVLYMLTVVYLVRKQMKKVEEEEVQVVMTNEKGETVLKDVDKILNDDKINLL